MITHDELKSLFSYDPSVGVFIRKIDRGPFKAGITAGTKGNQGYIRIQIGKKIYGGHQLAWMYIHGEFPSKLVDHINSIRHDNRIENLRLVTPSENAQNLKKARSDNGSGLLGVTPIDGKWVSRIMLNGKSFYLGYFETPELAHTAYINAKRQIHSTCTI